MRLKRVLSGLLVVLGFAAVSWSQDRSQPDSRVWVRSDYLLWWVKRAHLPALVTTGPIDPSNPSDRPGELGRPATQILLGNKSLHFDPSSGGRFALGGWIGDN